MSFRRFLLVALVVCTPVARAAVPLEAGMYFQPMTIPVGGTSAMTIEITNPNDIAASGLAISDNYPGGIFNASPVSTSTTCGGTFSASAGGGSFTFSGGSVGAHATCVLTIGVSASQGMWVNALDPGSVTSTTVPSNANFSSALLIVEAGPSTQPMSVAASFTPASIHAGKTTVLSIALTNPNGTAMNDIAFSTEYPSALINTPDGARSSCGGTATAKPGSRTLSFSGGSIPANSTCRVEVTLRGSTPGTFTVTVEGASASVTVSSSGK